MSSSRPGFLRRKGLVLTLGALGVVLLPVATSTAHPPPKHHEWREHEAAPCRVVLEDEYGQPLRTFRHRGQEFVLGRFGSRYQIRVENLTGRRVEAVVSVDGRDAISGRPGDYVRQRGYVLAPYGSVVVTGFRKSLEDVAAFRFTTPEDSYSGRMGSIENVGVIGVALFPEARARPRPRPRPFPPREERRWPEASSESGRSRPKSGAAPAPESSRGAEGKRERPSRSYPSEDRDASDSRLGTEYGETRWSPVTEVPFRRESNSPRTVVALRYDDRQGLLARGIDVDEWDEWDDFRRHGMRPGPDPFPDSRFAPPPP